MIDSFDGNKSLYMVPYWEQCLKGMFPIPKLVTLDPVKRCNLDCKWCNGKGANGWNKSQYSDELIDNLPNQLECLGVKAVCIAGGGEPTLHPRFSDLVENLVYSNIDVGVVTNGTRIYDNLDALYLCKWVGVSVDAGCKETYKELKGVDLFTKVIDNMSGLISLSPELEVTYKYLLSPGNNGYEIQQACNIARSIGCKNFHIRPAGLTWQEVQSNACQPLFSTQEVSIANIQLQRIANLSSDNFSVIKSLGKFTGDFKPLHNFQECWATAFTAVISADGAVGTCCDRRGDAKTIIGKMNTSYDFEHIWNSQRHHDIRKSIDLHDCPRCTYAPHNKLFEDFAISDKCNKFFY